MGAITKVNASSVMQLAEEVATVTQETRELNSKLDGLVERISMSGWKPCCCGIEQEHRCWYANRHTDPVFTQSGKHPCYEDNQIWRLGFRRNIFLCNVDACESANALAT